MKRERTLADIESYPKVKEFLKSKSRNSIKTGRIYNIALSHFQTFLESENKKYDIETVLTAIEKKKINVYALLDNFVGFLEVRKLSPSSILLFVAGVRSYLEKYDIDISPHKFKNQVTLPKKYQNHKEGLDAQDIRTMLQSCTNDRLKVFILVLASSGMRANEALSLRNTNIDFNSEPTKIHLRAEITKTKQERDIYISQEASNELKRFIDSKPKTDLIFSLFKDEILTIHIYSNLHRHFKALLEKVKMDKPKEGVQRREISFHSFRTFVFTTINDNTSTEFAKYILGHRGSTYYAKKEYDRREIYSKCVKYLTFLDYATVESIGKDIESKLTEKDKEIKSLVESNKNYENQVNDLRDLVGNLSEQFKSIEEKGKMMMEYVESQKKELLKNKK